MSKGNMLLGYSRGSVGDVVFARLKGQQIQRARNRQPANPRTLAQMMQRALFASAVEFYRRGVQNLFTFAFENKKATFSDYNAFMAANAKRGIYVTKEQLESGKVPMIGNYIMSQGSISRNTYKQADEDIFRVGEYIGAGEDDRAFATVGEATTELIKFGFQNGDIITMVKIGVVADAFTPTTTAPVPDPAEKIFWQIGQITLDETSTDVMPTSFNLAAYGEEEGGPIVGVKFELPENESTDFYAIALIVSRNEAGGVKVNNSELLGSAKWNTAFGYASAPAYGRTVAQKWGASEEAILQGSLS